ncbi:hypothetical protein HHI36_007165 [Cryptolaemus montrouzieri]|uniref:Uncharacterized protein n=1 Tax=Cryptolaemus montrouzieri TaxID=559131 RepID=A0ABD2MP18_9CUCU
MFFKVSVFLFLFALGGCSDVYDGCGDSYQCVEKSLVKYVDDFDRQPSIPVLGEFVALSRNEDQFESPRAQESFLERCARFMVNRELRFKLSTDAARSLMEETRSSKIKKIVLPLLILFKLKAAIVVTVVLAVIALISFKGLGASLIALAISGATGFKSLLENHAGSSKLSYEILPSISSHWSRMGTDPLAQIYQPSAFP